MNRLLRSLSLGACLPLLLLNPPRAAGAQSGNTTYNVAGGLALATGDFGNRNDAGFTLIAGIGLTQRVSPIALRAEFIYDEFDQQSLGGKAKAGGITGNAIYEFSTSPASPFKPYAIGGIGYYSTREPVPGFNVSSQTNVGFNIGGGVRFPLTGFSAYVEARYHSVSNADVSFLPIVFGVVF